jgi:hypothetical protein
MINDFLQGALKLLVPENPDWYGWAKTDSDGNKIPNDQRMQTQYVIVNKEHEGKVTRPTNQQINDKVAEIEADYASKAYARSRADAYDPITEQLDQIYWDMDGWKKRIKSVKDKFPKP